MGNKNALQYSLLHLLYGEGGSDSRAEAKPWMGEGEGGSPSNNEVDDEPQKREAGAGESRKESRTMTKKQKGRLGLASDPEELRSELQEIEEAAEQRDDKQGEVCDHRYLNLNMQNGLVDDDSDGMEEEEEITFSWDEFWVEAEDDMAIRREDISSHPRGGGDAWSASDAKQKEERNSAGGGNKGELPFVPLEPAWEQNEIEIRRSKLEARVKEIEANVDTKGVVDIQSAGWTRLFRQGEAVDELASMWSNHLSNHCWDIGSALNSLGRRYQGPHLERDRIMALLAGTKDGKEVIRETEQGGILVPLKRDVDGRIRRQDLPARLSYGCHKSARIYAAHVDKKVAMDLVKGWAFAVPKSSWEYIPDLCISPVGAVCQKEKVRVVHDLTFSMNHDTSLNDMVNKELLPECDIGKVFDRFAERAYGWRMLFPSDHLVMRTIDVVDAFRTKMIAPQDMSKFSYIWRDFIVIDTRLQFGYCGAPGHFQRHSNAMTEAHNLTRWDDPAIDKYLGAPIMDHLRVEDGWTPAKVMDMPLDRRKYLQAQKEYHLTKEIINDASIYIDDMIQLQVNQGDRLVRSAANSVRVNYEALGLPGQDGQGPLGLKKFGGWSSTGTMLGIAVDLNKMLFSLPVNKLEKLRHILFDLFPRSRESATLKEIQSLVGTCRSYAFCIRAGRYFLRRMINVTLGEGGTIGGGQQANRVIRLNDEFHRDLDWWRKIFVLHREDPDSFALPIWAHVKVRPELIMIGDSSGHAGGGAVLGLGVWFRCEWPEEIVKSLINTNAGNDAMEEFERTTIAHLELAVMVLGIGVMIENMNTKQPLPVLALCDNTNAVSWHRKAGARCPKASELIRILGELETKHKVYLNARHVAGIDNILADEISRRTMEGAIEYMEGGRELIRENEWFLEGEGEKVMKGVTNDLSWKYSTIPQDLWSRVSSCLLGTTSTIL